MIVKKIIALLLLAFSWCVFFINQTESVSRLCCRVFVGWLPRSLMMDVRFTACLRGLLLGLCLFLSVPVQGIGEGVVAGAAQFPGSGSHVQVAINCVDGDYASFSLGDGIICIFNAALGGMWAACFIAERVLGVNKGTKSRGLPPGLMIVVVFVPLGLAAGGTIAAALQGVFSILHEGKQARSTQERLIVGAIEGALGGVWLCYIDSFFNKREDGSLARKLKQLCIGAVAGVAIVGVAACIDKAIDSLVAALPSKKHA